MKNQVLRYVAIALLSFGWLVAGWVLAVGLSLSGDGITFPDGTFQTTAAASWNPAESSFVDEGLLDLGTSEYVTSVNIVDVPAGTKAVVESASVYCKTPATNFINDAAIGVRTKPPSLYEYVYFNMPLFHQVTDGGYAYYAGQMNTRLYSEPGEGNVRGYVYRIDGTGLTTCHFRVSGHFLPFNVEG